MINKIKRKIYYYYLLLTNKINNNKKYNKRIALVSNNKYKYNVIDDLLIQKYLIKNKVNCDIISWEENNNYTKYNLLLITSIWEYQNKIDEFNNWLSYIESNNINIVNNINIIRNNYEKRKQYEILINNNIPTIETKFIDKNTIDIESLIDDKEYVIKPCISGGGNNTFIITNNNMPNKINKNIINNTYKDIIKNTDLMLQPFIKEIDNGEISLVFINKQLSHSLIRYPNIFNNKKGIFESNIELDDNLKDIINKIHNIKEYNNYLYMRIDLVKINNEYKVMEIELLEPALFFNKLTNKKEILNNYAKSIISRT